MNTNTANVSTNIIELSDMASATPQSDIRCELRDRIVEIVRRRKLTQSQVAKLSGTSGVLVGCVLKGNMKNASTDLLIKILEALGYQVGVTVSMVEGEAIAA